MKMTELRHTVLILASILTAMFLLSGWWFSRQAKALREATQALEQTRKAHEEEKVNFAKLQQEREVLVAQCEIIQRDIMEITKQFRQLQQDFQPSLLSRAKSGFIPILVKIG